MNFHGFRRSCIVAAVYGTLLLGVRLSAQPILYGVGYPADSSSPATLYSINTSTGLATQIGSAGSIGLAQVGSIDFNPLNGVLYGIGIQPNFPYSTMLITINTSTGVGTEIGALSADYTFTDMSFRSDGTLYAYTKSGSNSLYSVNPSTGAATLIASAVASGSGNAIAFSSSDTLYYANDTLLDTINPSTGLATFVTSLTYPVDLPGGRANGMDFNPLTGELWTSVTASSSSDSFLATINTSTGVVTNIGSTFARLDVVAFAPVPEPSAWVLTAGTAALGFAGFFRRRRARIAS